MERFEKSYDLFTRELKVLSNMKLYLEVWYLTERSVLKGLTKFEIYHARREVVLNAT